MCSYLGVYEAAKLLEMEYLIPIVEISVSVCVWAEIQLPIEKGNKEMKLPELPDELNTTDFTKEQRKKRTDVSCLFCGIQL